MTEEKTKDELLEEVKKLREVVEKDSTEKKKNSGSNAAIILGIILLVIGIFLWQCAGIFD